MTLPSAEFDQLIRAGRLDEAYRLLEERRGGLAPDDFQYKQMVILAYSGRYHEAYAIALELLAREPSNAMARFCLARLAISIGHWQEGLKVLDECRNYGFYGGAFLTRDRPLWSGEPLAGKKLLLLSEGGLGDIVCYARFTRELEALGATVILVADQAMHPLLRPLVRRGVLLAPDAALKVDFDFWLPALSAPRLLGLDPERIDDRAYLQAPEELVKLWREELAFDGLKVGLIWKGAAEFAEDHFRSIREEEFLPLTNGAVAGARFFAIHPSQTGLTSYASKITNPLLLAGFLRAMDLVVTVDTGPAHLAGALGVPTILLNRVFGWPTFAYNAQPGEFAVNPWYRSMRVLQQKKLCRWHDEIHFLRQLINDPKECETWLASRKETVEDLSSIYHPQSPPPSPEQVKLVETADGPMLTVPNDYYVGGALALYGEYSRIELEIILDKIKPGDHVVEAGSHLGAHTVAIARKVGPKGHVIAFEPQTFLRQVLAANLGLQGLKWAEARFEALGEASGEIDVPVVDYGRVGNFGALELGAVRTRTRPDEGVFKAAQIRLDDLELERLDFLKLDVEGMELEALQGAENSIRRLQPLIWIEFDRDERRGAIGSLLRSWGYSWREQLTALYNPANFRKVAANLYGGTITHNILATPGGMRT